MLVLGVHYETHDSGAALVRDGEIVAAVNEERFTRIKNDRSAPVRSIEACLEIAGAGPEDVDLLALSGHPMPRAWLRYLTWEVHRSRQGLGPAFFLRRSPYRLLGLRRLRRSRHKLHEVRAALAGFHGKEVRFPHEHLHVTGAYWTAAMEDPVVVIAEGSGWDRTCTVAVREGHAWRDVAHTMWPHSPGLFYDCVTTLLGFQAPRHAGKITGLAAYGDPEKCRGAVQGLMRVEGLQVRTDRRIFRWAVEFRRGRGLPPELAGQDREDIAAAFQERLEEVLVALVANAVKATGKRQVALAGGSFANVKLNQRILELEDVDEIFIHPGMTDTGQALGAALEATAQADPGFRPFRLNDVYLGPSFSRSAVRAALDKAGLAYEDHVGGMEKILAGRLAEGSVVARFCGRMEYGPRALGNRSILTQPGDPAVNDWLNRQLKRTEFMPFAPSVPVEQAGRLFSNLAGSEYAAEFMTITCDCTEFAREVAPAIVHVDGTARPHLVSKKANPSYHRLLEAFEQRTGIPCLLNTSFNMHESPIVCTPEDAIRGFLESRCDYLAIEDYLVALPRDA